MFAPALGIDLGGTKIEAAALDAGGAVLWRQRVATPAGDYRGTLSAIASLVAQAERDLGLQGCTVGIGTPGSLTANGLVKNSNSQCLNAQPLARNLAAALGRPVRIANDANCLAVSEAVDGAGAGADVVFAAILGTGVGGGIVAHGRLVTGPNGLAGERGHNPLPWADAEEAAMPCYCGRRGCVEAWLSGPALARDHAGRTAQTLGAREIAQAAASGDAGCADTLERHAERLARALASVINLLDPDVIVLGGGLSQLDSLYARVPALWRGHVFTAGANDPVRTRLVRSRHGDASGVRGAAWLWRE
mgnify:CR=1 FL=1